jgi:asparagine synthase (glutamine-hydrolysing)
VPLTESRLLGLLPSALKAMDQPTVDGMNTYVISQAVKEAGVTVALSGLGGDELFAGYPSFRRALTAARLNRIPLPLRRTAALAGKALMNGSARRTKLWDLIGSDVTPRTAYSISRRLFSTIEIERLAGAQFREPALSAETFPDDVINAVSQMELQGYMANTLLRDSDCMSMAHALEVRVPFIDVGVVPFVLQLPGSWKVSRNMPKPLLIEALAGMLPEQVWRRKKMGFSLPFERWMHSALKPDVVSTFRAAEGSVGFDLPAARAIWERFLNNPAGETWTRPWALFVIQKWCELNGVHA